MNAACCSETKADQTAWLLVPGKNLPQPCRIRRYGTGRMSIETPGQIPVRYGIDVVHNSGGNRICHGRSCVPTKRYGALRNLRHRSGRYGQCGPPDCDMPVSNISAAPTVRPMMISDI